MKILNCYFRYYQCDKCEKYLDKERNCLYKYQGCGKYHNKKCVIYVSSLNMGI